MRDKKILKITSSILVSALCFSAIVVANIKPNPQLIVHDECNCIQYISVDGNSTNGHANINMLNENIGLSWSQSTSNNLSLGFSQGENIGFSSTHSEGYSTSCSTGFMVNSMSQGSSTSTSINSSFSDKKPDTSLHKITNKDGKVIATYVKTDKTVNFTTYCCGNGKTLQIEYGSSYTP